MTDDLSSQSVLIHDSGGLFLPLAFRLARDFGRVSYYVPNTAAFPTPYLSALGDGFDEIDRREDFWQEQREADLIVFPDTGDAALQVELARQGRRVWGSRHGDDLELRRSWFRHKQREWGLEVPEYEVVRGLWELRDFLALHDGWFVKVSRWRGLTETFQFHAGPRGEGLLDALAVKLGPLEAEFPFIVEAPIDAVVETGIDEFCIDGQWPETVVQGLETKDRCYIGAVTPMSKMPQAFRDVNEALAPFLRQVGYRNAFSAEVRITEDERAFLIDPCSRFPTPAGECLLELIDNLGEVMWHGANGELVEPVYGAQFAVQAAVDHPDDDQHWRVCDWPEDVREAFKPFACVGLPGGRIGFPPFPWSVDAIGSVVAVGDTLEEALDALKEHAAVLEDAALTVHLPDLAETLASIHAEHDAGIRFTGQEVPEPA